MEAKRVMTLIGKEQAVVGKTFRLYSVPNECRQCRLFNICVARLKPGRFIGLLRLSTSAYHNLINAF